MFDLSQGDLDDLLNMARAYAHRHAGSRNQVADLTEVFTDAVVQAAVDFDDGRCHNGADGLRRWCRKAIRLAAMHHFGTQAKRWRSRRRNGSRLPHAATTSDQVPAAAPEPWEQAHCHDLMALVQGQLCKLPPRYANVLRRLLQGQTLRDIGRYKGVSHEAVRQMAAAAMKKMTRYVSSKIVDGDSL